MNNEEAKFLLQAYRPGGRDAQDPQFAEALEQVKNDPQLERWFRQQQALDAALGQKIQSVLVPASLKANILAGRKTIRPTAWWTQRPMVAALAACFVLFLSLAIFVVQQGDETNFQAYRSSMVQLVKNVELGQEPLKITSSDLAAIQTWIAENSLHENIALPKSLTAGSGIGCRVIDWNGQSVALACFHLAGGQVAHLLVINRADLPDSPGEGQVYTASMDGMNTSAWSHDAKTYLLVSSASADTLQSL